MVYSGIVSGKQGNSRMEPAAGGGGGGGAAAAMV